MGLKFGIVNNGNCTEANQNSKCIFIKKIIEVDIGRLTYYNSTEIALNTLLNKEVFGMIIPPSNLTKIMLERYESEELIEVFLDQSEYHKTWITKMKLLRAFKEFSKQFNGHFEPVNVDPMFGSSEGNYNRDAFAAFIVV
jgi:hypothetical protein